MCDQLEGSNMVANPDVLSWDTSDPTAGERERFRIDNDEQAVWAMRKLAAARTRLDEIAYIAEAEIQRIQAWAEHESREPLRDVDYFEGILVEYGMQQRAEGRKSVSTPYGTIKSRAGQAKWSVDADTFIEWAKQHRPDLVRVKEEPALSTMKEALSINGDSAFDPDSGEVVPGVIVTGADTKFTVEVSK